MSGSIWIALGVLAAAFAAFAIPYGFALRSEESKERMVAEIRGIAAQKIQPNQIAIFQQINNNFVFQGTRSEREHAGTTANSEREARIILSLPTLEINSSHNVSSIIDNGLGDISIVFERDFPDKGYYVHVTGDKTINYEKIVKEKGFVRITFQEEQLQEVQVVCTAG